VVDNVLTDALHGLLGGLGGLALAVVLMIALKKFSEKVGESAFQLLARLLVQGAERSARLFSEDKRLTRYRSAIPRDYDKHPLTRSREISVNSLYVSLQYERAGARRDLREEVIRQPAVLLLGEAGAGKSLLLKYFLLKWAAEHSKSTQKIPIFVELHRCDSENPDLLGLIAADFKGPWDRDDTRAKQFIEERLKSGGLRLLFDGLDEVSGERQAAVVAALDAFRKQYTLGTTDSAMVVTCRSSAYNGNLAAFTKFNIADFDDASILRFLGKWFDVERSKDSGRSVAEIAGLGTAEALFDQIRDSPQLIQLARTPLLLSLLADLYTSSLLSRGRALPSSRSAFYARVTDHMVTRDLLLGRGGRASPYEPGEKLGVLKRVALEMMETRAPDGDQLIITWDRLHRVVQAALTAMDLNAEHERELLKDLVDRSQLLVGSDNNEVFRFSHRSFQEYFAARALEGHKGIQRLLDGYWSDPAFWRDTVRFWCGLAGNDSTEVVKQIFNAQDPRHKVLALECLADASEIDEWLTERIISHFMTELHNAYGNPDLVGVAQALGFVAARATPRGRAVRDELKSRARAGDRPAIDALARSGRPDSAEFLVNLAATGRYDDYIRGRIRVMGEAAVPALGKAAKDNPLWLLDALGSIGTPSAAVELSRFLWAEVHTTATRSAWWIAAMLLEPNVEAALRDEGSVPVSLHEWQTNRVIWEPFSHGEQDERLSAIAARVGYLISPETVSATRVIPEDVIAIDARIGIPLSGFRILAHNPPIELGERDNRDLAADIKNIAGSRNPLSGTLTSPSRRREGAFDEQAAARAVHRYMKAANLDESTIRMVTMLNVTVQAALMQELMGLVFGRRAVTRDKEKLWARALRDSEHQTGRLWALATGLGILYLVAAIGIGVVQFATAILGGDSIGPAWLDWIMTLLTAVAIIMTMTAVTAESESEVTAIGAILFSFIVGIWFAGIAILIMVHFYGILAATVVIILAIASVILPSSIALKRDEESKNPFRKVLRVYRETLPSE
jgi:NACHT domain